MLFRDHLVVMQRYGNPSRCANFLCMKWYGICVIACMEFVRLLFA